MRKPSLHSMLDTPVGVVIVLAAAIFGVELLLMTLIRVFLRPAFGLSGEMWSLIDAVSLTIIITPLLYWLVFRKIKEREDYLRQINAAAQDAIIVIDERCRVTEWNHAAQEMFQYGREEAIGQQLHELIVPSSLQDDASRGFSRFQENGDGVLVGRTTEIMAQRKDGSKINVELSISAVDARGGRHAIGIVRDITERKLTEEATEKARKKFHTLFESIADPILILGMNGRFIHANKSASAHLGYSHNELLQLSPADIDTPEYAAKVPERIRAIMEQGSLVFETMQVHRDGTPIQVELNSRLIDYDGKPAVLSVVRNISERKRMEDALRQAKEDAEHALSEQRQLVAMISHEYRSPLAVIDSSAQLLDIKLPAESDMAPVVARIRRGISRLINFLDNCLIEGRMDGNMLVQRPSAIDLHALAASVTEDAQFISENHRLITELDPDIPILNADPHLMEILLLNLLGNAVKYSSPGSKVRLRIKCADQVCSFEVIDQGKGIPADEIPFVFQKYMRGRAATSIPGAGLGLSLVSRIAALHDGRVEIKSREGKGTHVTVVIPLNFEAGRKKPLRTS